MSVSLLIFRDFPKISLVITLRRAFWEFMACLVVCHLKRRMSFTIPKNLSLCFPVPLVLLVFDRLPKVFQVFVHCRENPGTSKEINHVRRSWDKPPEILMKTLWKSGENQENLREIKKLNSMLWSRDIKERICRNLKVLGYTTHIKSIVGRELNWTERSYWTYLLEKVTRRNWKKLEENYKNDLRRNLKGTERNYLAWNCEVFLYCLSFKKRAEAYTSRQIGDWSHFFLSFAFFNTNKPDSYKISWISPDFKGFWVGFNLSRVNCD